LEENQTSIGIIQPIQFEEEIVQKQIEGEIGIICCAAIQQNSQSGRKKHAFDMDKHLRTCLVLQSERFD